jgi:hypothetical protein
VGYHVQLTNEGREHKKYLMNEEETRFHLLAQVFESKETAS